MLAFFLNEQLFELDPAVGRHIEYTFGDGIHKMPTALYVMDKVQAQVFYHLSPSEVHPPPQYHPSNLFAFSMLFLPLYPLNYLLLISIAYDSSYVTDMCLVEDNSMLF